MLTVAEINAWLTANDLSRKDLAEMLGGSYKSLCHVLSGARPLSDGLAARIEKVMSRKEGVPTVTINDELEPLLRTWADAADMSLEELVNDLLKDALKIKKRD